MNESVRKLIAGLQVIGGTVGAATAAHEAVTKRLPLAGLVVAAAVTTAFLFAVFAGVMLWRDTRIGRVASVVCQLVQLPKVFGAGGAFVVSYACDVSGVILARPNGWGVTFDLRALSHFWFGPLPGGQIGVGLSLTSCLCLWALLRRQRAIPATPPEPGSPDAVTAFQTSQQAIRDAKAKRDAEHPKWVPSRGMKLLLVTVLAVALLLLSCCLWLPTLAPMPLGPEN